MVDSQPMEEEIQGAEARDTGTKTHRGPTEPVLQAQKTPSPSLAFIKENINVLRTMIKEHDQQAKIKATPERLAYADSDKEASTRSLAREDYLQEQRTDTLKKVKKVKKARRERSKPRGKWPRGKWPKHQETSSDSKHEEGSEDAYEDLNTLYKRPKPTPFTQRITHFKYRRMAKLPQNIRVYEGNKDPDGHLGIFLVAAEQEEWPMPVWCKFFCQTLGEAARNWFDDLDTKSVDNFKELSQKFLEEFSQQKRYAKDPTEIHGIKRRQYKGLQAFIDWFKSESSHINGVPPVICISAFMHGHGHPELAKKLNDKIPKTMDEMFQRVRAFIRGEVAAGSTEMVRQQSLN
ncbi:reverse transcriptase domain-containing protein [Tanacetum coccineum]